MPRRKLKYPILRCPPHKIFVHYDFNFKFSTSGPRSVFAYTSVLLVVYYVIIYFKVKMTHKYLKTASKINTFGERCPPKFLSCHDNALTKT